MTGQNRQRAELAGLDDRELLGIIRSRPRGHPRRIAACELLVGRYRGVVWSCVKPYSRGPEPTEDLMQVGYAGLIAAINNFDPAVGSGLSAYARPYIAGEIKRYFRDKRWQVHVARPIKELAVRARAATGPLTQELGRTPAESDLASYLGVSGRDLRAAQLAELAFHPASLDAPIAGSADQPGATMLADVIGGPDPRLDRMLDLQAVATHWHELPLRERKILSMRFYEGMNQNQIGERLGISQMQVSRLLAHALGYLRPRLLGLTETG
jgi:RNA polymerase sigma-B factor